jgi:hypothetical protein
MSTYYEHPKIPQKLQKILKKPFHLSHPTDRVLLTTTRGKQMTDYLPPPPAVIDLSDPHVGGAMADFGSAQQRLMALFDAQGGINHKFVARNPETSEFFEPTVGIFNTHFANSNKLTRQINQFENALKQYVSDNEIDVDVARDLADYFGITLNREVQFCIQVEFTFTAEVPLDEDVDSAIENFNFNVETGWGSEVDIDYVDAQIIHNEWQEV